ncbi:hypothetical protein F5144DRAFT_578734 [Chaetomium tenue]|uniref:Uncharacterized protein n=1 Tax=Chaetomium tenue TaxID=1854479 RepID=A0ACB7P8Q0_9PEZI|nr:hypothetical protein F5144DRAFT_578734 [Chaetomium globosum]
MEANLSTRLSIVQSNLSAMVVPLEGMHSSVFEMEQRFNSLENQLQQLSQQLLIQQPVINGRSHEIIAAEAIRRFLARPAALRDFLDTANVQASEMVPAINSTRTRRRRGLPCPCRYRRQPQSKNLSWGSLVLSSETTTEQHTPDCLATQEMAGTNMKRSRKVGLTYTGLRKLANIAVQISLSMSWGAGAFSLSPNFTYYPCVDSKNAPILKLMSFVAKVGRGRGLSGEKLARSAVSTIVGLFQAGKASPRSVDADNRSLVYHIAANITMPYGGWWPNQPLSSQGKPHPLLELLKYLVDNGAPAFDYDSSGRTPLSRLFMSHTYRHVNHPLYAGAASLILRSNTEGDVAFLSKPDPAVYSTIVDQAKRRFSVDANPVLLHFLAGSTGIAEAYGCGPLSLAILSNDLEQVQQLAGNHRASLASLAERNLFGHTPLHLAADRPSCMRIIVKETGGKQLNQIDKPGELGMSALETALFLSGSRCRESTARRMCEECECTDCAAILLEAGCAVPLSACLQSVLCDASERCRRLLIRHMKNRRDKLKELALKHLSPVKLSQLGHTRSEGVLDSAASQVIQALKDRGIDITDALEVTRSRLSSVYQALCNPEDAELFFQAGFYDTDSWCNADQAELGKIPSLVQGISYLHWLATHEASSCQFKSFKTPRERFVANLTFWRLGKDLHSRPGTWIFNHPGTSSSSESLPLNDRIAWIHEVNAAVLPAAIADNCRCNCSPGGCTPLSSLLKGFPDLGTCIFTFGHRREFSREQSYMTQAAADFTTYLELFGVDFEVRHHTAALRYVTFTVLGIPHTCCDPYESRWLSDMSEEMSEEMSEQMSEDEDEDEHAYEFGLLEKLLGEFEAEVIVILQDSNRGVADIIRFWNRTWVSRMRDVLNHLNGNGLGDDERKGAEEVGVKWDLPRPLKPPKAPDNPYEYGTLEYWKHELEKIKAECE